MENEDPSDQVGLLHQVLGRLVEILRDRKIGVRLNENGEAVCYYCGEPLDDGSHAHQDHVYARSAEGVTAPRNLVLCCDRCNLSKQAKHPLAWVMDKDLPDGVAIDFLARLLIGVYFSYRRRRPPRRSTVDNWRIYGGREFSFLPKRYTLSFELPSFPLGERVEVERRCSSCGCAGVIAQLPEALLVLLRCPTCGASEVVEVISPDVLQDEI